MKNADGRIVNVISSSPSKMVSSTTNTASHAEVSPAVIVIS